METSSLFCSLAERNSGNGAILRWRNHDGPTTDGEKESNSMPLTREFKVTVKARAERDAAFREALLTEAVELLLAGEVETGKAILRDYINATIGFERLAKKTGTPPKSLMRMLSPTGN